MVKINNKTDLASLREVVAALVAVLENGELYNIVNFEAEKGTSRTDVPGTTEDHAVQRIGISIMYVGKNGDS